MNAPTKTSEQLVREVRDLVSCARSRTASAPRLPRDPAYAQAVLAQRLAGQCRGIVDGWQVIVSVVTYADGVVEWHASAMLHPPGRSSNEGDWAKLGQIVAATGATGVEEQLRKQMATLHPNRPHHWHWTKQG